jgi:hypothetical protein
MKNNEEHEIEDDSFVFFSKKQPYCMVFFFFLQYKNTTLVFFNALNKNHRWDQKRYQFQEETINNEVIFYKNLLNESCVCVNGLT